MLTIKSFKAGASNPWATFGLHKCFKWPAQYFLKPSLLSILAEVKQKFDVNTLFSLIFIKFGPHSIFLEPFLTIILVLVQKVANQRLISGEDFFFFRDHYNFGAKSGVFSLYGPPISFVCKNGPKLKKVGYLCFKATLTNALNLHFKLL